MAPAAGWGWRPGIGTAAALLVAALFAAWLFTPTWSRERGIDAKVMYAAASLQNRGGNPYDPYQEVAEQDRLFNVPAHIAPGQPGYSHGPYGYPPLFTALLQRALPLGFDGFYLAIVAILLAAGLVGFEAVLRVAGWHDRWLARGFFVVSSPVALSLFVGNPSPILLLGWAIALLMARRGRPFVAGVVLTLCLLKLPVGLPATVALLVGTGRGRLLIALGLGVGSTVLAGLQLVLTGPEATANWVGSVRGYASGISAGSGSAFSQSGLAGFPALFLDFVPLPAAVLLGLLVLAAVLLWAWRRLPESAPTMAPDLWLALILVGAVGATPYLHLNDLVIMALPLVLLAQTSPTVLGRLTEVAWSVGVPARLLALAAVSIALKLHPTSGSAGIGALLVLLLVPALVTASSPRRAVDPGP
jgi:hypothetical protein